MRYFSIILGVGELFLRITENGYISLRELEEQCRVNLRFMYLMNHQTPSYRTFGYFIDEGVGYKAFPRNVLRIFCNLFIRLL